MTKREIKRALKQSIKSMEIVEDWDTSDYGTENRAYYKSVYLGSFLDLDPCGRYHHVLSPNGITKRCERFWYNLEECAEELGCWLHSGEGDALDVFMCMSCTDEEIDSHIANTMGG